jgi:hypothetical protein
MTTAGAAVAAGNGRDRDPGNVDDRDHGRDRDGDSTRFGNQWTPALPALPEARWRSEFFESFY